MKLSKSQTINHVMQIQLGLKEKKREVKAIYKKLNYVI